GRTAFGPITADDIDSLVTALHGNGQHAKALGLTAELPWMRAQNRWTFARVGVISPLSTADYESNGGLAGWRAALAMTPAAVIDAVTTSGLRGRGGAAFPTGIKWKTVADAPAEQRYICANADEGDSGTFADRMLMEGDPFALIEGMAIAGYAVGATQGYIYIRSEYPAAVTAMRTAIQIARHHGWLGEHTLGSDVAFDIHVRVGAGAYICGEETSMLESLEGKRGEVRAKPPLPAHVGLFGKPTVVNNVITLASVPGIIATPDGAAQYAALGTGRSTGTNIFQLAGNIARGGALEVPFGITLRALIEDFGGGTASGRSIGAVQVGGPLGAYLTAEQIDVVMDYEAFAAIDALVGHGGIVVFDDSVNMAAQARFAMEFCSIESCGKCTPCRIGSTRGVEMIDARSSFDDIEELCETMADGSLCAMGGLTPLPVRSAIKHWPEHFAVKVKQGGHR
ncbi:MAG TPA: NADH-ubiquinone oxidoreductase-F iron-sulfur binding region domain-containing protein, partial [Ilumatobacteraceae bacterium]|nr:NADH-ubiquinone oxidoreductase-F iron-sulfur binding region domain-containing protein [Ilumatobacteraceae bacterium]